MAVIDIDVLDFIDPNEIRGGSSVREGIASVK